MPPFTNFVVRHVGSLYNQLLKVARGRSSILGVRGSLEPWVPEEVDYVYLIEVCGYHALDTTSCVFQVPQNLSCTISTCQMKLCSLSLPPVFCLHTARQRKASLITQYVPDSTEVHKTSHTHKQSNLKTGLDEQTGCADICWFNIVFL